MYQMTVLFNLFRFHMQSIINLVNTTDINSLEEDPFEDASTDSSSTSVNHQKPSTWWEYLIFPFLNGGSGGSGGSGSSPGFHRVSPTFCYKPCIAKIFQVFVNNTFSYCEHSILNGLSILSDFSSITLNNYGGIIAVLYLIHKFSVFIDRKYKFSLIYRVPSHILGEMKGFDYPDSVPGVIILRDFISRKMNDILTGQPKIHWCNYMKYTIPAYYRMHKLCKRLGLVRVNRLNLVLDSVHHSYAGAGMKSILNEYYRFSSILVQITTAAYSPQHKRKVYRIFNILILGGIGVVVWYKCLNHFQHDILIPEPHARFKNPTAVVDGYERVTYWMNSEVYSIVDQAFKHEQPFNDIIPINKFWSLDGIYHKDQFRYIGLAVMIATFITTGILNTVPPTLG